MITNYQSPLDQQQMAGDDLGSRVSNLEALVARLQNNNVEAATSDEFATDSGVLTAGEYRAVVDGSDSSEPTDTGFTGSFMSGIGQVFNAVTYNVGAVLAGVLGVGFNTAGQLLAGAGAVILDALGITLTAGSGSTSQIKWLNLAQYIFQIYSQVGSSVNSHITTTGTTAVPDASISILTKTNGGTFSNNLFMTAYTALQNQTIINSSQEDVDTSILWDSGTALFVEGSSGNVGLGGVVAPASRLDIGNGIISNVTDPVSAQDAATKAFVLANLNNFDIKLAVRAASQGNLNFTRSGNIYTAGVLGVLLKATIDSGWSTGAALAVGDRLLLANQTSNVDNGIVTITSLGAIGLAAVLTRATDMDIDSEVTSEMRVPVSEGTDANIDYKLSAPGPFTLNTTALPFTRAGGPPTGAAGGDLSGTYPNPSITNAAVIAKVLTGFSSGAGTVSATDSILTAFQKVVGNIALSLTTLGAQKSGLSISGQTLSLAPDGWTEANETWTYVSASTFTCPTDQTARYKKGTLIKWTQTTVKYGVVAIDSTVAAGVTTMTIIVNTDYTIANAAISSNFYSYSPSPLNFPDFFNWAANPTGYSAQPTNTVYRYKVVGHQIQWSIRELTPGTSNGTGITFTPPTTAATITNASWQGPCYGRNNSGDLTAPSYYLINSAGTTIIAYPTYALGAWTNTGTKCIYSAQGWYEF